MLLLMEDPLRHTPLSRISQGDNNSSYSVSEPWILCTDHVLIMLYTQQYQKGEI